MKIKFIIYKSTTDQYGSESWVLNNKLKSKGVIRIDIILDELEVKLTPKAAN